jgi:hypothetical protein
MKSRLLFVTALGLSILAGLAADGVSTQAPKRPYVLEEPLHDCGVTATRIIPPEKLNTFDLPSDSTLFFTPTPSGFKVELKCGAKLDPSIGDSLELGHRDTRELTFPAGFPFLGNRYSSIWVNSGGSITLGAGDRTSATVNALHHVNGPPRISPLLADLAPSGKGAVHADVQPHDVLVTWRNVTEHGTSNTSTFQATLHQDGRIVFTYSEVVVEFAVVGVAQGGGKGPFAILDFTGSLLLPFRRFPAGAIFEEFSQYGRERTPEEIVVISPLNNWST